MALFEAPILQGQRAHYLGDLGVEARLLGVEIRENSEVVKYADWTRSPGVVLRGGQAITADVILVADGIHSNGRQLLRERLGPAVGKRQEKTSDYSIYRGLVATAAFKGDRKFDCEHPYLLAPGGVWLVVLFLMPFRAFTQASWTGTSGFGSGTIRMSPCRRWTMGGKFPS